ncbi:MAG: 3-oxoacyl-ACP synthase III [Planctomycetaceae bacterium]
MRYRHVCLEAFAHRLPPHVVTSDEIEERLRPVYDRLKLPAGRLELMTGIRERRFFNPGMTPGRISAETAAAAVEKAGIDRRYYGALIHGSVSRDQLEPATANVVHHAAGLPAGAVALDVSNACLGILNGMLLVADMIELGQIRAGVVVGTETGRDLVEHTIESLLNDPDLTRNGVKNEFASLTIGSGSAAVVLCDDRLSRTGNRLLGGGVRSASQHYGLCAGGDAASVADVADRPRMQTDSEALLHAGIDLAGETWTRTRQTLGWSNGDVRKVFTHQVGRAHRKLLLQRLQLDPALDFPTVEFLGNTGAVALPMAASLGIESGHVQPGDNVALLGIGSGLNCLMLGMKWQA